MRSRGGVRALASFVNGTGWAWWVAHSTGAHQEIRKSPAVPTIWKGLLDRRGVVSGTFLKVFRLAARVGGLPRGPERVPPSRAGVVTPARVRVDVRLARSWTHTRRLARVLGEGRLSVLGDKECWLFFFKIPNYVT